MPDDRFESDFEEGDCTMGAAINEALAKAFTTLAEKYTDAVRRYEAGENYAEPDLTPYESAVSAYAFDLQWMGPQTEDILSRFSK